MHAWRVNNEVYVKMRGEDLLRQARADRLAAACAQHRQRPLRLAYLSGVVLDRVGSRLVRLGRQLQGMLPESSGDVPDIGPDIALAGPAGKRLR